MNLADTTRVLALTYAPWHVPLMRVAESHTTGILHIGATLDCMFALKAKGIQALGLWSLIDPASRAKIHEESHELRHAWFSGLPASQRRVGAVAEDEWTWFFRDALYLERGLRDALERFPRIEKVLVPGPLRRPASYYASNDTPSAVAAFLALASGRKCEWVSEPHTVGRRPAPSGLRATLMRRISALTIPFTTADAKPLGPAVLPPATSRKRVGLCFHGLAGFSELADVLSANGCEVVLLGLFSSSLDGLSSESKRFPTVDLSATGPGPLPTDSPETQVSMGDCSPAFCERWPFLFANPLLDFHFRHHMETKWPAYGARQDNMARTLAEIKLDLLITSNLTDVENGLLVHAAKRTGIPVAIGMHSGWPDPPGLLPHADRVMIWSKSQFCALEPAIRPRTAIVGPLRSRRRLVPPPPHSGNNPFRIIVASNGVHTGLYPLTDVDRHLETYRQLFDVPEDVVHSVNLIVKCKPHFDHPRVYEWLVAQRPPGGCVSVLEHVPLGDILSSAHLCLMVNVPTTGFLEAAQSGVPVAMIQTTRCDHEGLPQPSEGAVEIFDDVEKFWDFVRGALMDPSCLHEVRCRQQVLLREDFPFDEAAQRTWAAVAPLLRGEADVSRNTETIRWPVSTS